MQSKNLWKSKPLKFQDQATETQRKVLQELKHLLDKCPLHWREQTWPRLNRNDSATKGRGRIQIQSCWRQSIQPPTLTPVSQSVALSKVQGHSPNISWSIYFIRVLSAVFSSLRSPWSFALKLSCPTKNSTSFKIYFIDVYNVPIMHLFTQLNVIQTSKLQKKEEKQGI